MVNGQIVNIMMKKTYISPVTDMVILQSNIALMKREIGEQQTPRFFFIGS